MVRGLPNNAFLVLETGKNRNSDTDTRDIPVELT